MVMTSHDLDLPPRSPTALREEVAGRVVRRRRQRARRRIVRLVLPAGAAVLAFVLGSNGMPGAPTGVDIMDSPTVPPSDGTVEVSARRGGTRATPFLDTDGSTTPGEAAAQSDDDRSRGTSSPSPLPTVAPRPVTGPGGSGSTTAGAVLRVAVARPDGIWELDADGRTQRRLVDGGEEPAWSPDGRRLAYTKRWEGVNGGVGVAVLDLDSMQSRYVAVGSDADYRNPAWSPDGAVLAVARLGRNLHASVVVVDADDGAVRFEFGPGDWPSWRHDGAIVHRCGSRLCVRSADGMQATPVPGSDELTGAAWSPDGAWIAAWTYASGELVVLRQDGSGRRTVVGGVTGSPAWAPDGAHIVHASAEGLRSVHIDGSGLRAVTDQPLDADPHVVGVRS